MNKKMVFFALLVLLSGYLFCVDFIGCVQEEIVDNQTGFKDTTNMVDDTTNMVETIRLKKVREYKDHTTNYIVTFRNEKSGKTFRFGNEDSNVASSQGHWDLCIYYWSDWLYWTEELEKTETISNGIIDLEPSGWLYSHAKFLKSIYTLVKNEKNY